MADKESINREASREATREVRHLVSMANDIADNLGFQADADAESAANSAGRIADHINRFWTPRMRALLLEYAAGGGQGLSVTLLPALEKLKT